MPPPSPKESPHERRHDDEGREAPFPPPELNGWFDCRSKIHTTQDELIDAVVRRHIAEQPSDRIELEAEFRAKTGATPHALAEEKTLVKVLDSPLALPKGKRK